MKSSEDKPNIFLLVMDTARASNFSTYGYGKNTDPNISRMAEEGMKFENCYSNCIWTLPSHYSMFTGKLPSHHGAISKQEKTSDLNVLPKEFSERGYTTSAASSNGWISSMGGFDQMFENFHFLGRSFDIEDRMLFENDDLFKEIYEKEADGEWDGKKQKYLYLLKNSFTQVSPQSLLNGIYYLFKQKSLGFEWRDGAEKSNAKIIEDFDQTEKPFFGFINYVEPHDPYTPPKRYAEEFLTDHTYEEAMEISLNTDLIENLKNPPENAEVLEQLYDAEIKYLDSKIQEFIQTIEEKSDRENIFIIASDHGENFDEGENLWGHYGKITRNLTHVPLIIKGQEDKEIEKNFSLRNIHNLILSLLEDELQIKTSEAVITEYWGLDSHNWEVDDDGLPEEYFQKQRMATGTKKYYFESENFSRGSQELKDYIELRCGGI